MAKELKLTKKDRISVWLRSTFLQGSWNYERMQNGGWAFAMIPAIKRLYKTKEERSAALKRHLEFFMRDRKYDDAGLTPKERFQERQSLATKELLIELRSLLDSELTKDSEFRSQYYKKLSII